jgi:pimeloyl-[acyl-carrier protein] methyl ester esterase
LKKIICLSGWGQKFDSLESIFDSIFFAKTEISSFNYSQLSSLEEFFSKISQEKSPDILIGWSLGGQLAIRAIEKNILKPKLLILLAPPFQMVKDVRIQAGMAKNTFDEFYNNFAKAPSKTLKQFAILTAMNDKNASEIAKNLDINDGNFQQLKFWLEELERFSCFDVNFETMPKTLYFHGAGDMIVHASQSKYFQERIKNFHLEIFKNCGHAPHLNNLEKLREIILQEINNLK